MKLFILSVSLLILGMSTAYGSDYQAPEKNNITEAPNIITYGIITSPGPQDESRVIQAIDRAFDIWKNLNPSLHFMQVDEFPDAIIHWNMEYSTEYVGKIQYTKPYGGLITLRMGSYNCEGIFVEFDSNYITNTTMHEVGHLLGLGHTTEVGHLMYSGDDPEAVDKLDTLGYNIPKNLEGEGYFVGEKLLYDRLESIDDRLNIETNHDYYNHILVERNLIVEKINCFNEPLPLDSLVIRDILIRLAALESNKDTSVIPSESNLIVPAPGSGVIGCEDDILGCYIPNVTKVSLGSVVEFSNTDSVAHTFTSGESTGGHDDIFDSGLVITGQSYNYTTDTKGTFPYFCIVHPWMTGTLIVE